MISSRKFSTLVKLNSSLSISKVVQWVWNYLYINFHQDILDIRGGVNIFAWNYCAARVFFSLYSVISVLLSNETGLKGLSKVVQQMWNDLDINFHQDILDIHGGMNIFAWNYCAARVFFSLYSVISVLLLNETGLKGLSKVVQQV